MFTFEICYSLSDIFVTGKFYFASPRVAYQFFSSSLVFLRRSAIVRFALLSAFVRRCPKHAHTCYWSIQSHYSDYSVSCLLRFIFNSQLSACWSVQQVFVLEDFYFCVLNFSQTSMSPCQDCSIYTAVGFTLYIMVI